MRCHDIYLLADLEKQLKEFHKRGTSAVKRLKCASNMLVLLPVVSYFDRLSKTRLFVSTILLYESVWKMCKLIIRVFGATQFIWRNDFLLTNFFVWVLIVLYDWAPSFVGGGSALCAVSYMYKYLLVWWT